MDLEDIADCVDGLLMRALSYQEQWRDTMPRLSTPIQAVRKSRVFAIRISYNCVEFRQGRFRPKAFRSETFWDGNPIKQVWHKGGKVLGSMCLQSYQHFSDKYDRERYGRDFRQGSVRELPSSFAVKVLDPEWRERVGLGI